MASAGERQVVSGYMWTPTVPQAERPDHERQLLAPARGDRQFGTDQRFAPDRGLEVLRELLVEPRVGGFFAGEGLVEGRVVGQFVEVGLVAEREASGR